MSAKYKAIFFDADDTLFDYPNAERAALLACLGEFSIPTDSETFIAAYRRHNRDVWREFERGDTDQATLRVERFRRLAAELGLHGLPLEKVGAFYLEALACQPQLLPGALELVRELAKRFPLALVTNGIAAVQNKRFAASPITPYFRSIVISEEVGIAKPDPRIFGPALEKLGVAAGEVLYVGDSATSDMAAARNAGMDFCWLNPKRLPCPGGLRPGFRHRLRPGACGADLIGVEAGFRSAARAGQPADTRTLHGFQRLRNRTPSSGCCPRWSR